MARKLNAWMRHVMAERSHHPGKSFKDVLRLAKKTYKKSPVEKEGPTRKHRRRRRRKGKHTRHRRHKRRTHKRRRRRRSSHRRRRRR